MYEALLPFALVAATAAYVLGDRHRRVTRGTHGWSELSAFCAGMVVVAVALVSPLDGLVDRLLWAHMVQHVLLISVAAPLLAIGRPFAVALAAWPRPLPTLPKPGVWVLVMATATAQVVTLLVWHVPAAYDAALEHEIVHGLEHVSLLATAVCLWAALVAVGGEQAGLAVVALFLVSFPPLLLGGAMTFATTVWYSPYAEAGAHALTDQQLAGVVMWAYGGLAAGAGGVYLFVRWLRDLERASPGRPAPAGPDVALSGRRSC